MTATETSAVYAKHLRIKNTKWGRITWHQSHTDTHTLKTTNTHSHKLPVNLIMQLISSFLHPCVSLVICSFLALTGKQDSISQLESWESVGLIVAYILIMISRNNGHTLN